MTGEKISKVPIHIREAASLMKEVFGRIAAAAKPSASIAESEDEWEVD